MNIINRKSRYFLLSLLIISSFFYQQSVNAQMLTPQSVIDDAIKNGKANVSENVTYGPNISILEPMYENKTYSKDETVQVTFSVTNNDIVDYPDLTLSARITVYKKEGGIREYGNQTNLAEFFLAKKSTENVKFDYTVPAVPVVEGDVVRLEIQILQKTGQPFGNTGNFITIQHSEIPVEIQGAFVNANDQTYMPEEGPVIDPEESIRMNVMFANTQQREVTLYPKLKVYDLESSRAILETKEYESITLTQTDEVQFFVFDFPLFSKPGVYAGELSFVDDQGVNQFEFITSRWIIDGDMATISGVTIDKSSLKKGETALVEVVYTGAPINIDTGEARQVGIGKIKVELYNEKKELIGSQEKEVNFSTSGDTAQFEIQVTGKAKTVTAQVIASKDNKELASYRTNLTDPSPDPSKQTQTAIILSLITLVLILILALFVSKKMAHKKMIVTGLSILVFFSLTQTMYAAYACLTNDFCASSDLNRTTFTPGEYMGWNMNVEAIAYACRNQGGITHVDWVMSNGATGWFKNTYDVIPEIRTFYNIIAKCSPGRGASLDCSNLSKADAKFLTDNAKIIQSVHGEYWRNTGWFNPAIANTGTTHMYAPSVPGYYTITIWMYNTARFKDGGTFDPIQKGPISFTFGFNVVCPDGQYDAGGYCANNVVPPPPPTNAVGACSPNGATANFSWTNASGYDTIYFRAMDTTLYPVTVPTWDGNTIKNDNVQGTSHTMNTIPGHSYLWWIHTKDTATNAWSTEVQGTFSCPVLQCNNDHVEGDQFCENEVSKEWNCVNGIWETRDIGICPDTVSCSVNNPVTINTEATYTANTNIVGGTYQWYASDGITPISSGGSDTLVYKEIFRKIGQFVRYIKIDKGGVTKSAMCAARVEYSCSKPADDTICVNGIRNTYVCNATGGYDIVPVTCGGGGGSTIPKINKFLFDPYITTTSLNSCPLYLDVENTSGCRLQSNLGSGSISIPAIDNKINQVGDMNFSVGTYTLYCTNVDLINPPVESRFPETKSCISNPNVKEN